MSSKTQPNLYLSDPTGGSIQGNFCYCSGNLCNGAEKNGQSLFIVLFSTVLATIMMQKYNQYNVWIDTQLGVFLEKRFSNIT
jgi:hypothetical protein